MTGGRIQRMPDGAYCPVCGRWIPETINMREDWEQDEISSVIECEYCELMIIAYINPIKEDEGE